MQILLTIAFSLFFLFLIGKLKFFRIRGISVKILQFGFVIKLLAGIAVGLVYTYYYTDRLTADTFKFFDDSKILFDAVYAQPLDYVRMLSGIGSNSAHLQHYYDTMTNWYDTFSPFNDNRTMIRLNAFLRIFSMGYYYVHVAVVCFLSYIGIVLFVKVFSREFPENVLEIFLVFLLLPSVLFWGSGLLKDALVFFTFGLMISAFNRLIISPQVPLSAFCYFILTLFLLMITKFQVFLISLPLISAWFITTRFKINVLFSFSMVSVLFFILVYGVSNAFPGMDLINLLVQKQQAFFTLAAIADAGSIISIPELKPEFFNLLINAPIGFFTSLTRPFISDTGAVLNTISAIENILILGLGIYCIVNFKLNNVKGKILPVFCLFYTLYSFTLIGMITPVLGAIVRYKAQALPFMVVLFIIAAHPAIKKQLIRILPKSIL